MGGNQLFIFSDILNRRKRLSGEEIHRLREAPRLDTAGDEIKKEHYLKTSTFLGGTNLNVGSYNFPKKIKTQGKDSNYSLTVFCSNRKYLQKYVILLYITTLIQL